MEWEESEEEATAGEVDPKEATRTCPRPRGKTPVGDLESPPLTEKKGKKNDNDDNGGNLNDQSTMSDVGHYGVWSSKMWSDSLSG